jgi:hypothetical protein
MSCCCSDTWSHHQKEEESLNKSKPYCSKILVNNPYLRDKISISLAFSSAAILLVLTTTTTTASPLVLFNIVPVQAQTNLSFRTSTPADGSDGCMGGDATLSFDAQGTPSSSNPQRLDITSGTFTVTARDDAQKTYSGSFDGGSFTSNSGGGGVEKFALVGTIDNVSNAANCSIEDITFSIGAPCSTTNDGGASNPVTINTHYVDQGQAPLFNNFNGMVECSSQGGDTTTQSSSTTTVTVTTQDDRDGDGILDANDNCPNLPHTRCYKEGDTALAIHNSNR